MKFIFSPHVIVLLSLIHGCKSTKASNFNLNSSTQEKLSDDNNFFGEDISEQGNSEISQETFPELPPPNKNKDILSLKKYLSEQITLLPNKNWHTKIYSNYLLSFEQSFKKNIAMDERTINILSIQMEQDIQSTHWVFICGGFEFLRILNELARTSDVSELREVSATHFSTLDFISTILDKKRGAKKYFEIFKWLYIAVNSTYLDRSLKEIKP
jgi:hypothetical protein